MTRLRFQLRPLAVEAVELPVNGVRVAQCGFGQALGGLTGRRQQQARHAALFEQVDQHAHAGGFAHTWPAADDRHLAGERRRDGPPLFGLEHDLMDLLRTPDRFL